MALSLQSGIAAHAGADNPLAIPLSAVVGIPLYIRAEAVIPLASVLMTKGMGPGINGLDNR